MKVTLTPEPNTERTDMTDLSEDLALADSEARASRERVTSQPEPAATVKDSLTPDAAPSVAPEPVAWRYVPSGQKVIDVLEQQAAQIEFARALRADAERMRELLADANETLHGNYTVLMRLILTNPPGGRYSFFAARDGSMIEATGPINQTMTVIAALDAALRQEQPNE